MAPFDIGVGVVVLFDGKSSAPPFVCWVRAGMLIVLIFAVDDVTFPFISNFCKFPA